MNLSNYDSCLYPGLGQSKNFALLAFLAFLTLTNSNNLAAQNTGGIFGPVVNENHESAQYRIALDPDTDHFAHRIHYQQSIDGSRMWRVIAQARETSQQSVDFDFFQGEIFWQISPDEQEWQTGLRFDLRVRDDDRPGVFGINWMNHISLSPELSLRANFLTSAEFGENSRDGIFIGSRGHLNYRFDNQLSAGIEMFSAYGSTTDFLSTNEQRHQIGPFASITFPNQWRLFGSVLFGINNSTPDKNARIFINRSF